MELLTLVKFSKMELLTLSVGFAGFVNFFCGGPDILELTPSLLNTLPDRANSGQQR